MSEIIIYNFGGQNFLYFTDLVSLWIHFRDLLTVHGRIQQKYIATTKAAIRESSLVSECASLPTISCCLVEEPRSSSKRARLVLNDFLLAVLNMIQKQKQQIAKEKKRNSTKKTPKGFSYSNRQNMFSVSSDTWKPSSQRRGHVATKEATIHIPKKNTTNNFRFHCLREKCGNTVTKARSNVRRVIINVAAMRRKTIIQAWTRHRVKRSRNSLLWSKDTNRAIAFGPSTLKTSVKERAMRSKVNVFFCFVKNKTLIIVNRFPTRMNKEATDTNTMRIFWICELSSSDLLTPFTAFPAGDAMCFLVSQAGNATF